MPEVNLLNALAGARRRRWLQTILRRAAMGLALGATVSVVISGVCSLVSCQHSTLVCILTAALGLASGVVLGAWARPTLAETALAIDRQAALRDRVHSALQFSLEQAPDAYRQLQIRDATDTLRHRTGSIARLFPLRWPREGTWASAAVGIAVVVGLLVPAHRTAEALPTGPPEEVLEETRALSEDIERFETLSDDLESKDLRELTQKLRRTLSTIEKDTRTREDAMGVLAQMTSQVEATAAQFDPMVLDQQLREVAEGIHSLDGFRGASEMLKQNRYDRAAESLQQLGDRIGEGRQSMPSSGGLVDTRIGQLSQQVGAAGLQELSEAMASLQQAITKGSPRECRNALGRVASVVRSYGRRSRLGRTLQNLQARISQCKSCVSGSCSMCNGKGGCSGTGTSLGAASLSFGKSDRPSQKAGTAVAAGMFGSETKLNSNRSGTNISSHAQGDGPSEKETETTTDGRQQAARDYQKVYAQYRKISDVAMVEEAIPLAHRQLIKRYFETIHPSRIRQEEQLRDVTGIRSTKETTEREEPTR